MTLDELLQWRTVNGHRVLRFLKQHREVAGVHYMTTEDDQAYIEFVIKPWGDLLTLEGEVSAAFPDVPWQIIEPDVQIEED